MPAMISDPLKRVLLLLALLVGTGLSNAQPAGFDPDNCLLCHSLPWFAMQDENGNVRNFHLDEGHFQDSAHGRFSCRDCHGDIDQIPHKQPVAKVDCATACHIFDPYTGKEFSHRGIQQELAGSVHGEKGAENLDKPGCTDCHVNSLFNQALPAEFEAALGKCSKCHENEAFRSNLKHMALHVDVKDITRSQENFRVCARCHTNSDILSDSLQAALHGDDMVSSFMRSFHGRGLEYGDERSPGCADCHGYHGVYDREDERSSIHTSNLVQTCSTIGCHEQASYGFATAGSMHDLYSGFKASVLLWIKMIYLVLIVVVISGMMLHNLLDTIAWFRHRKKHPEHADKNGKPIQVRRYMRMNRPERWSHIIMFVSFTWLALSGALLWVPKEQLTWMPEWVFQAELRAWSHRLAAIALVLVSLYHMFYIVGTRRGRGLFMEMLPRPVKDVQHVFQNLAFMLGMRDERPKFGHFNYTEKAEYWAFAWGSIVMTATGIILWFEHLGSKFFVDAARLVHSLEAILAVVAIVVWHFWNVHWRPGRWPMSNAWIDGHINEEEMEEEHSGLLEDYQAHEQGAEASRGVSIGASGAVPKERRRKRVVFLKFLGYTFFFLITISTVVMGWSFMQYVKGPQKSDDIGIMRTVDQKDWVKVHPNKALGVVHEDADWKHERFHTAVPVVELSDLHEQSECLACHSLLPHAKELRTRSYLNSHSRFMSCETCHAPEAKLQAGRFVWTDMRKDKTGRPAAPYGLDMTDEGRASGQDSFDAMLMLEDGGKPFYKNLDEARVRDLLERRDAADEAGWADLREREADRFHDRIQLLEAGALTCDACHVPEASKVDWEALGFSEKRADFLKTASIPSSVVRYEEFHLAPAY